MKCVLVVLLLTAACGYSYPSDNVDAASLRAMAIANAAECSKKYPISQSNKEHIFSNGKLMDENDRTGQCYVNCLLEKQKFVVNDTFDVKEASRLIHEQFASLLEQENIDVEKAAEAVKTCTTGLDDDHTCTAHYKIWSCMYLTVRKEDDLLGDE